MQAPPGAESQLAPTRGPRGARPGAHGLVAGIAAVSWKGSTGRLITWPGAGSLLALEAKLEAIDAEHARQWPRALHFI